MNTITFDKLLLKTAFCCMASDGHVDDREISLIRSLFERSPVFKGLSFEDEVNALIRRINSEGKEFVKSYLGLLEKSELTKDEELMLIDFAMQTIRADDRVEYAEIKFFKNIRNRLKLDNTAILAAYPEIESFLEEDIVTESSLNKITIDYLESTHLPTFEFINISDIYRNVE